MCSKRSQLSMARWACSAEIALGIDQGVIPWKRCQVPVKFIFRCPDMGPQSAQTCNQGKIAVVFKQLVTDMLSGSNALLLKLLLQALLDHLLLHEVDHAAKGQQRQ